MNRIQKKYLFDISERIDFIFQEHLIEIATLGEFEASRTAQSAVERELIVIGEAVYKLSREGIKVSNADNLINRRNTIVHQYDVFSAAAIWVSIHSELPDLKKEVELMLKA